MIDADATARLVEFFAEIKNLAQFMDCDEVGVHTRGFQGETPLKIAVVRDDVRIVTDLLWGPEPIPTCPVRMTAHRSITLLRTATLRSSACCFLTEL